MAAGAPAITNGEDLLEFETEHLGFRALAQGSEGPKKLKLLPTPWPADSIPPACATLLSIASKPGLIAAAGPDALVIAKTEKVRKAFNEKAGEWDVVTEFTPDVTVPLGDPPLRHVLFSSAGDFLVISAEGKGGLAVFSVPALMSGKKEPEAQIRTDDVPVRVLVANPMAESEHFMAVVLDTGKLCLVDITTGETQVLRESDATCVTWSSRGKAVAAGLKDGSMVIYMMDGAIRGTIPRPESVDDGYEVTGIVWIKNTELLVAHGPKGPPPEDEMEPENKYHVVKCDKAWSQFEFRSAPWDPLPGAIDGPSRQVPSRFSAIRLQNWEPDLDDMLIITTSHTDSIAVLTSSSKPLTSAQNQENCGEWVLISPEDSKKAAAPRLVYGEEGDSVFIGETIDLSVTEKILRPIPALEEISEAPSPLPAYMALTHQGVLCAWWVMWNRSIEQGTRYPALIAGSEQAVSSATASKSAFPTSPAPTSGFGQSMTPANPPTSGAGAGLFAKPTATFGTPSAPQFGAPSMTSTPPSMAKLAQPAFGASGFGATTSAMSKPAQPAFGASGFGSAGTLATQSAGPAFGAPSSVGMNKGSGFGAVGGMGSKPSPWAASSSNTQSSPFASAAGGASGFAKFGQTGGASSGFSSFGSNNSGQSGFGALGQNQQKSGFPGLKSEPSAASTIDTLGSAGSTLPSWANTPAQSSSLFGQTKSSFNTSSFESKMSDTSEAESRKRDEATPTPQPAKGLFGLAGGFKLGTTFAADGTAKDDPAKPAAPSTGSFFGSDFASGLGGNNLKPPATPAKETGKDKSEDLSTTPASPPRQQKSFFSTKAPAQESATPKAPPPIKTSPSVDDAPLPPDFLTTKAPKSADDDLPPLAGSPGVKVEAPSSSVEASPIDEEDGDDEGDFSVEEDEDDDSAEQPLPSVEQRQAPKSGGWSFQDSVNQSPRVLPAAPTPPATKAVTQPALFGQGARPAQTSSLFNQASKGPLSGLSNQINQSTTPAKPPYFPPPTNRAQENLRSPSPIRSASTSALHTRREPLSSTGTPLRASVQQATPPTQQPQEIALEDEDDQRKRAELASAVEPSRTLEDFVAYQTYTGKSPSKTGHAAQIEMIFKDINGMIDGLGWNSRSIKSFTEYHKQPQSGHKVDRRALEDVEDEGEEGSWFERWTLGEVETLKNLEADLERDLEEGRVQDVFEKLSQLARLLREKAKLMTRLNDIRRQIINRKDPDKVEASRKAPLTKEAAELQKTLRRQYASLLTSLAQAEEESTLLRSRIVAHSAQQGKTAGVPTVDAVKKTINKMASMAEKRNSDITLLESEVRKLGLTSPGRPSSSSSRTMGTPRRSRGTSLRNSIAESPFVTPPTNRFKMSLSELNRQALTPEVDKTPTRKGYGLEYSPEGSVTAENELSRISDVVEDNLDTLRETAKRRKQVATGLKKALVERGVRTTKVR